MPQPTEPRAWRKDECPDQSSRADYISQTWSAMKPPTGLNW